MDTKKLKNFAQETRRKLLNQVEAKLEHVLEADTGELREKTSLIKELKKDLDRHGREQLIDKIAYTWFNRFVALRYMDARGFQPFQLSVLSPENGQVSPELLQEAMGGHIPGELKVDQQQIMDILDGRTNTGNPENEAYRLLLIGACNHLHEIFPFLFEPIDDYTELLLPDDLTSEFSVIRDVVDGMATEDCQQVEVLGWLYQFYISEKKDEVFASKGKVKKEELPAATQLFTPRWIVEYMVQNTVGKLWVLNHPNSKLKEYMPYYIESNLVAEDVLTIESPEELTLLDQACGSGHILVYGFELLYKIYEEEGYAPSDIPRLIIEYNLHGFEIDERAAQLAGLAILMKAREKQQRLFRKSDVPTPNITCFEDLRLSDEEIKATLKSAGVEAPDELFNDLQNMQQATNFGSLIVPHASVQEIEQAKEACKQTLEKADLFEREKLEQLMIALDTLESLGTKYCCVVDNPPYMKSSRFNKELKEYVNKVYHYSKSDLMTCFMESGLNSVKDHGVIGLINQHSWMFTSSYEDLRNEIIGTSFIDSLLHLGPRTFPEIGGEVVQSTSFTLVKDVISKKGKFIRLVDTNNKRNDALQAINDDHCSLLYTYDQNEFSEIAGTPIAYWVSGVEKEILKEADFFIDISVPCTGMQTGANPEFTRSWFEVSKSRISNYSENFEDVWCNYQMGGDSVKWIGNNDKLIYWKNNGEKVRNHKSSVIRNEKFYGKRGISWKRISSSENQLKLLPEGMIFDQSADSLFVLNERDFYYVFGYLNSKVLRKYFKIFSPTMNLTSGSVEKLPIYIEKDETVEQNTISAVKISEEYQNTLELNFRLIKNELIRFNQKGGIDSLEDTYEHYRQYWTNKFFQLHQNEEELNRQFIEIYGLQDELTPEVPLDEITILQEELDSKKLKKKESEIRRQKSEGRNPELPFKEKEVFSQFISYAVGCMFGRYSLDKEGLILANQGETLEDFLKKVEKSKEEVTFLPDDDNIIPVLDDEWFEDDIVARFHQFLKASFGEENFQKNLAFVEENIKQGDIRKYFDRSFYRDHYKRYSKRPIYWKFSSPKGHFSVLIYMHRYTPDTLNNILNNYLRAFIEKLETRKEQMQHLENTGSTGEKAKAAKEIDKLNAMIKDCKTYEREILYPLASERIEIDLDDGVLVNYNLFGDAVEEIKSVNDKKKKKKVKEFDWIDGGRVR